MQFDNLIFLVKSGPVLGLLKEHIAKRQAAIDAAQAIALELGAESFRVCRMTGVVLGIVFKRGEHHPDFKMPAGRYRTCQPRKGSAWYDRFSAQIGHPRISTTIAERLQIPLNIVYSGASGHGIRCIGVPMGECGFAWISSEAGPYAMWIPDVPSEVAYSESQGFEVDAAAKNFRAVFEGCEPIDELEWEILVKKAELKKKLARLKEAA